MKKPLEVLNLYAAHDYRLHGAYASRVARDPGAHRRTLRGPLERHHPAARREHRRWGAEHALNHEGEAAIETRFASHT
jgi:hypothetical protein